MSRKNLFSLMMLAGIAAPGISQAATVTACGPTVCYEYNDAQAGTALFGLPTLVADSLRFLPGEFRALTTAAGAFDLATATFVIDRIYSVSGLALGDLTVTETGDHRIWNDGGVTADLYILAANNAAAESAVRTDSFEAAGTSGLQLWSLSASLNPASLFSGAASDVALVIQNTLAAIGGPAFIQKKEITVGVSAVPLPATAWLLAPGIALLAGMGRRRRARRLEPEKIGGQ